METEKYYVSLLDGTKFETTGVNFKALHTLMTNNKIVAVKVGGKGLQKQSIAFIAKETAIDKGENNIAVMLANSVVYLNAENTDAKIEEVTNEVNKKQWIMIDESILFSRNAFQCVESVTND